MFKEKSTEEIVELLDLTQEENDNERNEPKDYTQEDLKQALINDLYDDIECYRFININKIELLKVLINEKTR